MDDIIGSTVSGALDPSSELKSAIVKKVTLDCRACKTSSDFARPVGAESAWVYRTALPVPTIGADSTAVCPKCFAVLLAPPLSESYAQIMAMGKIIVPAESETAVK